MNESISQKRSREPLFRTAAQITPTLLTTILRAHAAIDQSTVTAIAIAPITGDSSFNAQLFRLSLHYDRPDSQYPTSLIAKLPTATTRWHETSAIFQPGKKETWFYRHGAKHGSVNTPHCYYNALDPVTGASILTIGRFGPGAK
ncbi:MAG: hypothetical protein R3C14_41125 [Caldilineaceae bacterium]